MPPQWKQGDPWPVSAWPDYARFTTDAVFRRRREKLRFPKCAGNKMKIIPCFEIRCEQIQRGIKLQTSLDGREVVMVGEVGRGRHQTAIAPPEDSVIEADRLVAIVSKDLDAVCVVCIRDASGFRGSWRLAEYATTKTADSTGLLLPDGDVGVETLGTTIAAGACAQGDAGRMGGGPECLIAMHPCRFSIRRGGRIYGKPAVLNVEVTSTGEVTVVDAGAQIESASAKW
jgi:hypothetical protein